MLFCILLGIQLVKIRAEGHSCLVSVLKQTRKRLKNMDPLDTRFQSPSWEIQTVIIL